MNSNLMFPDTTPASPEARAIIARSLAGYYSELAGLDAGEPSRRFSLARFLLDTAERRPLRGREREVSEAAAMLGNQLNVPHREWVPWAALGTRAMGSIPGSKGGFLVGSSVADPVDILRPWSVVAGAGVQTMNNLQNQVTIPRVGTAPAATWIGENGSAPNAVEPVLGSADLVPHTAIGLIHFSMQLLRQGEAVEAFLRAMLLSAVGQLLDVAFFSGAGGVQPMGLLNTPGINTQAGGNLTHANTLTMRQKVLTAGAVESNLQWVGPPAVQEVLGARERVAGGGRFLWDTDILGRPAFATQSAPASTLVCGDFSQAVLGVFGPGVRVDVDPSQNFNTAGLTARVLLMCDVAFPQPAAFTVATSVT